MDASSLVDSLLPVADTLAGDALLQGGQVREWIARASGPWRYLLVFVLAAIPWLEILLVIPAGIAIGLDPLLVAGVAFAGNALPIYGIVLAYERLAARFGWGEGEGSKRRERARRVWNSYGLPGLAFAAPVLTGVHLAAVIALGLGARGRSTLGWMTASIAVWTVAITAATVAGVAVLGL
ncbi:small multi-drug export protein [Saliphagus sp. LR7]|uniref:small multi-drug export protein n=1 Tax=Saliphagus sp. LR7 TaxID=2282654 RepID=UPI000DF80E6F|nr:small multi-drug export protein [Saliphagus sp. LR7]